MVGREWVFWALQGGLIEGGEGRTLLCRSRRDTRPMLTFPFDKLKYYPNSCSVLIFQAHSRKKWSYCGRGLLREDTCTSAMIGWLWLIVFHKAQSTQSLCAHETNQTQPHARILPIMVRKINKKVRAFLIFFWLPKCKWTELSAEIPFLQDLRESKKAINLGPACCNWRTRG